MCWLCTGGGSTRSLLPPPYLYQDGDPAFPPPFSFPDLQTRSFPLAAKMAELQTEVDRFLNIASEDEMGFVFHPLAGLVYLTLNTYPKMISEPWPFSEMGFTAQQEMLVSIPVVRWVGGIPTEVALFSPYVLVDQPWSVITGREVLGFPKVQAGFKLPSDFPNPYPSTVETLVFARFSPETPQTYRELVRVESDVGSIADAPRIGPLGPIDLLFASNGDFPVTDQVGVFALVEDVTVRQRIAAVQLKEFRDAGEPERACYQAITRSILTTREAHFGLLSPGTVELRSYASLDIPEALGLGQGRLPAHFPFWLRGDTRLDDTRNLYIKTSAGPVFSGPSANAEADDPGPTKENPTMSGERDSDSGERDRRGRGRRVRREDPERTGPIRDWRGWFQSGPWSQAAESRKTGSAGPSDSPLDTIERGVKLAYRVVEDYLEQGRRTAQRINDRQYGPREMGDDLQAVAERMVRDSTRFLSLWFDLVGSTLGMGWSRDWRPPWASGQTGRGATSTARPTGQRSEEHRAAGEQRQRPAGKPGRAVVAVEVGSTRPARVEVEVPEGADEEPLTVTPLHPLDTDAQPITGATFTPASRHEPAVLSLTVPPEQPVGHYHGTLADGGYQARGTVTVHLSAPPASTPPAGGSGSKSRSRARAKTTRGKGGGGKTSHKSSKEPSN